MTGCRYLLLLVFLVIGMIQDFRNRRISSRLLLIGVLSGILIRFFSDHSSYAAVFSAAADLLLPVLLLFPLFLIHALGAGDIKLCSLIGCYIGYPASLQVIYLAFVLGSIWFLATFPKRTPFRKEPFAWTFPTAAALYILFH